MEFSQLLQKYRKDKKISQENLAQQLGVSRQAVSKWETGETMPELSNFLSICTMLEVSPDQLCGHEEKAHSHSSSAISETEGKSIKGKNVSLKKQFFILLLILCFAVGSILGMIIGRTGEEQNRPVYSGLEISNLVVDSLGAENGVLTVQLTFSPNISNDTLEYKIIKTDSSGNAQAYDVKYENGICIGEVDFVPYTDIVLTATAFDGENTYSKGLVRIYNIDQDSYSFEKL